MPLPFGANDLFGVFLLGIGVVVLAFGLRYVWRATAVYRASEVTDLGGVDTGTLVRLSGAAKEGDSDVLVAPFSGRECLALGYSIEERRLSIYLLPWFVTIHEVTGADAFRVRTPVATVDVVSPTRTVTLERQVVATVAPDDEPPERVARFETQTDAVPVSTVWRDPPAFLRPLAMVLSLGTRRYSEQRLHPGDDVTVVGRVVGNGAGKGAGVDPIVVSDCPRAETLYRMAKTSLAGFLIGLVGVALGVFLLTV